MVDRKQSRDRKGADGGAQPLPYDRGSDRLTSPVLYWRSRGTHSGDRVVLILRIRRAETALADARLDEAFALARAADFAAHHKGQKLIGRLARALAARGQEHLAAGRTDQAAADCEKAAVLAGSLPEVAALRTAIAEATSARRQLERHRGDVLAAAREHLNHGRLSIGEQCLASTPPDSARVTELRAQAALRRVQAAGALNRARQALDREDHPAAAAALVEAVRAHPTESQVSEMIVELTRSAAARAASAIDTGRLDLVEALLDPAIRVNHDSIEVRELLRFVNGCREALAGINSGQPRVTAEALQRLTALRPSAAWLAQAARDAQQAAEHLQTLRAGPLGLLGLLGNTTSPAHLEATLPLPTPRAANHAAQALPPLLRGDHGGVLDGKDAAHTGLPTRLLLFADGIGSFLILRDRRVTIGPAGSSRHPDIPLLAEPGLPTVTIERTDEDYFVSCDSGVDVNGIAAKRRLLINGDRITVSPRAKARFVRPNAASTSAVLQLAGTRLPSSDARQVILMDREMILGPGQAAHVRADQLADAAIFQIRDGGLFCRCKEPVLVNEKPLDRHAALPLAARVQIGTVSFVVTAA